MISAKNLEKPIEFSSKYCSDQNMCSERVNAVISCHKLQASPKIAAMVVQCIISGYCEWCHRMTYMIQDEKVLTEKLPHSGRRRKEDL